MHPMEHLGDEAQVEAPFSLFWDSANRDIIGPEVILDALDRTPRFAQMYHRLKNCFGRTQWYS
jgi:hypothetical protein